MDVRQQLTSHPTKEVAAVTQKMGHPISVLQQSNPAAQKPWQRIWFHRYRWYTCKKVTQMIRVAVNSYHTSKSSPKSWCDLQGVPTGYKHGQYKHVAHE